MKRRVTMMVVAAVGVPAWLMGCDAGTGNAGGSAAGGATTGAAETATGGAGASAEAVTPTPEPEVTPEPTPAVTPEAVAEPEPTAAAEPAGDAAADPYLGVWNVDADAVIAEFVKQIPPEEMAKPEVAGQIGMMTGMMKQALGNMKLTLNADGTWSMAGMLDPMSGSEQAAQTGTWSKDERGITLMPPAGSPEGAGEMAGAVQADGKLQLVAKNPTSPMEGIAMVFTRSGN